MATLEIKLSEELQSLLRQHAQRTGVPEASVVESALKRELAQPIMSANRPDLTHDEWFRRLQQWIVTVPQTNVHLSNEDLRRVNMYDDERG